MKYISLEKQCDDIAPAEKDTITPALQETYVLEPPHETTTGDESMVHGPALVERANTVSTENVLSPSQLAQEFASTPVCQDIKGSEAEAEAPKEVEEEEEAVSASADEEPSEIDTVPSSSSTR